MKVRKEEDVTVKVSFCMICRTDLDQALEKMVELKEQGFSVYGSACWAAKEDQVTVVMKKRTIDDPKEGRK